MQHLALSVLTCGLIYMWYCKVYLLVWAGSMSACTFHQLVILPRPTACHAICERSYTDPLSTVLLLLDLFPALEVPLGEAPVYLWELCCHLILWRSPSSSLCCQWWSDCSFCPCSHNAMAYFLSGCVTWNGLPREGCCLPLVHPSPFRGFRKTAFFHLAWVKRPWWGAI